MHASTRLHVGPSVPRRRSSPTSVLLLGVAVAIILALAPAQAQAPGSGGSTPPVRKEVPRDPVSALDEDFTITEGNQVNWFTSQGNASAHTLVTNAADPRILVSYPDENCGTGIWFDGRETANRGLAIRAVKAPRSVAGHEADPGTFGSPQGPSLPVQGVTARFSAGRPEIVATEYVLDSVRVMRAQAREGSQQGPEAYRHIREAFRASHPQLPAGWARESWRVIQRADGRPSLVIERTELNGGRYVLELTFDRGTTLERQEHAIRIRSGDGHALEFDLASSVPFATMHRSTPQDLFRPAVLHLLRTLTDAAEGSRQRADRALYFAGLRDLLFLARPEKYMAGAWRFMTYFGRDTMISLMLLQDVLSARAREAGIESVLVRLSPDGDVAHEEDIGPFAEIRHIEMGDVAQVGPDSLAKALMAPVHDYKMVDDDFLLPILAARHLADAGQPLARRRALLARGDNLERLLTNWDLVLRRTLPFARSGAPTDFVRIGRDLSVGNWRDSGVGLGGGVYPGDVNADLVPEALAAIRRIVASGAINEQEIRAVAARRNLSALPEALALGPVEKAWARARGRLEVVLPAQQLRTRLSRFLGFPSSPSPGATVTPAERTWYLALRFADGSTLEDFLRGPRVPAELQAPLRFIALSADSQGRPVEVMNSDFVFRLFLGNPAPAEVDEMVRLVELPYPVGLMTPVGPVVANSALSKDVRLWGQLGRDAYHGAVMWSWQTSMLQMGLMRQWQRFRDDPGQVALAARLRKAVASVDAARRRAGALASSELWTWEVRDGKVVAVAFGQRAGSETESNAVQLWSTIFPAVLLEGRGIR